MDGVQFRQVVETLKGPVKPKVLEDNGVGALIIKTTIKFHKKPSCTG
jgi:hypothetical protein